MITITKSLVARAALGLVALAGVVAAVPASARPFEGPRDFRYDRVRIERGFGGGERGFDAGYRREWRPVRYAVPVIMVHAHRDRW